MQPYYYIKICGLTNVQDATLAADLGSDFLGMVFHPKSKRPCSIEAGLEIKERFLSKPRVLVFAYDEYDYIVEVYQKLRDMLTFIQIPADHKDFDRLKELLTAMRLIPVVHVDEKFSTVSLENYKEYSILILDAPGVDNQTGEKLAGGTGKTFDWQKIKDISRPFLLAGGLNPNNICTAIKQVDVFGFDASSGIESKPGKKDEKKLSEFFEKIRNSEVACK